MPNGCFVDRSFDLSSTPTPPNNDCHKPVAAGVDDSCRSTVGNGSLSAKNDILKPQKYDLKYHIPNILRSCCSARSMNMRTTFDGTAKLTPSPSDSFIALMPTT
jgi:hypothetical protein